MKRSDMLSEVNNLIDNIGCNKDDDVFDVIDKIKKEAVLQSLRGVMSSAYNRRFHNITDVQSILSLLDRIIEKFSSEHGIEETYADIVKYQGYMDAVYNTDFDKVNSKETINDMIRESIDKLYKVVEND